jgi:hypothetical protein
MNSIPTIQEQVLKFPKEAIIILLFATVIHTILMTSGSSFFGLVIYGILMLGLIFVFLLISVIKIPFTPMISIISSTTIFFILVLIVEFIRHLGQSREIHSKPSLSTLNLIIWSISGLYLLVSIGFLIILVSFPNTISLTNQNSFANIGMYILIMFGLFYGSMISSIR